MVVSLGGKKAQSKCPPAGVLETPFLDLPHWLELGHLAPPIGRQRKYRFRWPCLTQSWNYRHKCIEGSGPCVRAFLLLRWEMLFNLHWWKGCGSLSACFYWHGALNSWGLFPLTVDMKPCSNPHFVVKRHQGCWGQRTEDRYLIIHKLDFSPWSPSMHLSIMSALTQKQHRDSSEGHQQFEALVIC